MSWWQYMAAVQWNSIRYDCGLGTIQSNMPPGPLEIKEKATWLMPLHQTCQLTPWNFISQDCYIVNTAYMPCRELLCRCIYACWPSFTVTNTAAVQTCLLVEYCCTMDACWTVATQSVCLLSLNIACLLGMCFSICYTCWYGVSGQLCLLI